MRRAAGIVLALAGALLLGYAGTTYAGGALARDRARTAWDAEQARLAVAAVSAELDSLVAPPSQPPRGASVARLVVPAIGLDEIVVEGVEERQLNAGPGHLPGTPLPGFRGNSVISAHRDRHFRNLDDLKVGDVVETQSRYSMVKWVVKEIRVVGSGTPALFSSDEPVLTLTTCWPVRYLGSAPDRLLITAVPLGTSGDLASATRR